MNSASLPSPVLAPTRSRLARNAAGIVLGSLLVAVCAHVSIPLWFTPVPITLQTFAVLLLGLVLSPSAAALSLVLYLAEGFAGLPVFSPHGPAGFLHLLGPTGGYLLSYPLAAALTSLLRRRFTPGLGGALVSAASGSLLILLCGAAWFAVLTHEPARVAVGLSVLPFIPGDILKVAAAAGAGAGLSRLRRR
jgi:biotin transport system substrate-specific component